MLADGEIDALITARAPSCFDAGHPAVARLFPDYATVERDYYRMTGVFPIMHALAIRNDVHDKFPWLAFSLLKAYTAAKRIAEREFDELAALKLTLPWIGAEAAATRALMGADFWPYGVADNRRTLDAMVRYAHEQGMSSRLVRVDELFAHSTMDLPKI
jgi:4,5-dihydroxyphthalate decarboxylase